MINQKGYTHGRAFLYNKKVILLSIQGEINLMCLGIKISGSVDNDK